MLPQDITRWDTFVNNVTRLRQRVNASRAVNVNSQVQRTSARELAQDYFRNIRPELRRLAIPDSNITDLDYLLTRLLRLSSSPNAKSTYLALLQSTQSTVEAVEIQRELRIGEISFEAQNETKYQSSDRETLIYETLLKIVPTAGRSYRQALIDLSDNGRVSYRGPANDLREALREIVDRLAPDSDVEGMEGFKYEKDQTKPTRQQKVRFILRSRGLSAKEVKIPATLIEIIEDRVAVIASTTFTDANIVAHVQVEREQVIRIKDEVDFVLSEILEIPHGSL